MSTAEVFKPKIISIITVVENQSSNQSEYELFSAYILETHIHFILISDLKYLQSIFIMAR